ncbi:hemolysin [Planctomycetales bacterium]|nr:hemolysin [Planctomycetales bacterium]GHT00083.1 hemolysin [Planctomycetales bacterium]GHT04123.1 hemolysin [Planctomycetales bacterium]
MSIGALPALAALLLLSAVFSGSETAFFSLRATDLNAVRRSRRWADVCMLRLHADLANVLYTLVLGNLIVNTTYFAIAALQTARLAAAHGQASLVAASAFFLLTLIIFGEILPKTIGSTFNLATCRWTSIPLYAAHRALSPVCRALKKITSYFERALFAAPQPENVAGNLRRLFAHYRQNGVVSAQEYDFINAVVELGDVRAREIMTPRVDVVALSVDAAPDAALAVAREKRHSKILLTDARGEKLIGFVDTREIYFAADLPQPLAAYRRAAPIFSEFTPAELALRRFLQTEQGLAVITDEHGSDIGILTLSDILAEIFGETGERGASPEELIRQGGEGELLFDGRVPMRDLRAILGEPLPMPGVSTVGGLIVALLGRTPKINDRVTFGGVTFTVEALRHRRPSLVRLNTKVKS